MKILKNYLYNSAYQIFVLLVPLITIPYISRVLGPHGVGVNTVTYAYTQYFVLFATLGLTLYGQREIAYLKDDVQKLSKAFWEIEILSVITTLFSVIAFTVFVMCTGKYKIYYLAQSLLIFSCAVDVSWLFMGLEKFKITVLRNFVVKIASILLIFTFVKDKQDIFNYILIVSSTTLLGNLSLWPYLRIFIKKIRIRVLNPFKHLRPTLALFIPQVAISIYSVLNKVMLGQLSTVSSAGFFDSSDKIIRMCLTLVTAFTTVMMPQVANAFVRGENRKVKRMLNSGLSFAIIMSFFLLVMINGISGKFIPWFLGKEFTQVVSVINIESLAIIPIACAGILGVQYLVPLNRNKQYTVSIFIGAIVNIIINVPLISTFSADGAAVSTIVSEFCVTGVQFAFVKKDIALKKLFKTSAKVILSGFIVFLVVKEMTFLLPMNIYFLMLEGIIGTVLYCVALYLLRLGEIYDLLNLLLKRKEKNR